MQGDMIEDSDAQREEEELQKCMQAYEKETPSKPLNLLLPLGIILVMTLYLSWRNGQAQAISFLMPLLRQTHLELCLRRSSLHYFYLCFFSFCNVSALQKSLLIS